MSLTNPEFAERLEAKVRALYHANPRLLKGYDEQRKKRALSIPQWVGHSLISLIFAMFGFFMTQQADGEAFFFFALTVGCTGLACLGVGRVFSTFYTSWEIGVLFNLPVADREIFHFETRKYLRGAALIFLYVTVAFLAVCVGHEKISWEAIVAILLAGLQLAIVMTCTAWLVECFPFPFWGKIGGVLCLSVLLSGFLQKEIKFSFEAIQWLGLILPTGWVGIVLEFGLIRGETWAWSVLLPAIAFVATLPLVWRRLREHYQLTEMDEAAASFVTEEPRHRPGLTEITDAIQQHTFLRATDTTRLLWFERCLMRWLTPRERTIFELTEEPEESWTRPIHIGFLITPFMWAVIWLFGHHSPWLIFFPCLILVMYLVPVLGSQWRLFQSISIGYQGTAFHGMFPVGFGEVVRLVLKAHYLKLLITSPVVIGTAMVVGHVLKHPFQVNLLLGLQMLLFFAAWQPMTVVVGLSHASKDVRTFSGSLGATFGAVLLIIPLVVSAIVAGFFHTDLNISLPAWVVFLTCSLGLFAFCRHQYTKSRVDVITQTYNDE